MLDFFKRLFGKDEIQATMVEDKATAPLTNKQLASILETNNSRFELQQLVASTGQSVGRQRELNEDSLMAITSTLGGNTGNLPFGLYIVADGMGGHQYGEVASNAAVRTVAGSIMGKFQSYMFQLDPTPPNEPLQEMMQLAVKEAQKVIQREAPNSGTTLTAALVLGHQVTVAHVGDSRAYHIYPDGRIETITRDHSLVKRLEELGHLNGEEAENYPHRNVLYRALGQGELEPDIFTVSFPQTGTLMICSDGLWGVVPDEKMYSIIKDAPDLNHACQSLVDAANAAGGPDNISVVLVQMIG
jgi:protein phosphatase